MLRSSIAMVVVCLSFMASNPALAGGDQFDQLQIPEASRQRLREVFGRQAEIDARLKAMKQATDEATRQAAKQRAIVNARPENMLEKLYVNYITVKRCHEIRDGYAVVFINEIEMARAKSEIKALSDRIMSRAPSIADNDIWRKANAVVDLTTQDIDTCHASLAFLDRSFKYADPEGSMTRKDF